MTKRALIREYDGEIERLKAALAAARMKNGIYLPPEEYAALQRDMRTHSETSANLEGQVSDLRVAIFPK